jgi:transposase InsO family protein
VRTFLYEVIIDSDSKWLEVFHKTSKTLTNFIKNLRMLFAAYGLCHGIVSDNGPRLVSSAFKQFLKNNRIKQTLPAYHPVSNGAAERSVQILKRALIKKRLRTTDNLLSFSSIAEPMFRRTPHRVTCQTPAELFLKRQIRTRFNLLRPDLAKTVEEKHAKQKKHHDHGRLHLRVFQEEEQV